MKRYRDAMDEEHRRRVRVQRVALGVALLFVVVVVLYVLRCDRHAVVAEPPWPVPILPALQNDHGRLLELEEELRQEYAVTWVKVAEPPNTPR